MLKLTRSHITLLLLSGSLAWGVAACSQNSTASSSQASSTVLPSPPATVASPPPAPPVKSAPPEQADPYKIALDKAASALSISESAQSPEDWNLVASRWQQAIQQLRAVPPSSPSRSLAQQKLPEYQQNLATARRQAARKVPNVPIAVAPDIVVDSPPISARPAPAVPAPRPAQPKITSFPREKQVYRVRIKRRESGTPVIDVTFNGQQTFEMIVDTGASGTVITREMAYSLKVPLVGKAKVDTASEQNIEVPLAKVKSLSAGGVLVRDVVVAVGGSALELGLLGHDFFNGYDITLKRDVIEFRPQ